MAFTSTAATVDRLLQNEQQMSELWRRYTLALARKALILSQATAGLTGTQLRELQKLTKTELLDIRDELFSEEEIDRRISSLEHVDNIKRLHRLEQCLDYARTQYDYAYELHDHLCDVLRSQLHILKKLASVPEDPEKLIRELQQRFALEQELAEKISRIPSFHQFWEKLREKEYTIRRLGRKQWKLWRKLHQVNTGEENRIGKALLDEWGRTVFAVIQEKIQDGTLLPTDHHDVDLEFVNRPEFEDFAREKCVEVRGKAPTPAMLTAFVHMFREWYNLYRD